MRWRLAHDQKRDWKFLPVLPLSEGEMGEAQRGLNPMPTEMGEAQRGLNPMPKEMGEVQRGLLSYTVAS